MNPDKNEEGGGGLSSGKHKKNKKAVSPLYAAAITWAVYAMLFPLYKLWHFIIAFAITAFVSSLAGKRAAKKMPPEPEPEPEPVSYGTEADAIIAEGKLAQSEMGRLYASIKEPSVCRKINELMQISDKIVQNAIHDPTALPQIKKFLNYYLPTTIKLLNTYDRMGSQGISGENISGTMNRIEDMLDTAIEAFKKQLDSLFADRALDIETDIEVMNAMLAREGLAGSDFK